MSLTKIRQSSSEFYLDSWLNFFQIEVVIEPATTPGYPCSTKVQALRPSSTNPPASARCDVVDDGSTDNTLALARTAGAGSGAARAKPWQGRGAQDRLVQALKHGFEWALTLMENGQHAPDDLPGFMTCAEKPAPGCGGQPHAQRRGNPVAATARELVDEPEISQRAGRHLCRHPNAVSVSFTGNVGRSAA